MGVDELEELKKKVNEIHKALLGDYDNEGIISRLTKLEERSRVTSKFLSGIAVTVATLIVTAVWQVIVK